MKRTTLLFAGAFLILSCNQTAKQDENKDNQHTELSPEDRHVGADVTGSALDLDNIPLSTADVGDFPFFTLPKGLQEQNKPLLKSFDVCFFPVGGKMTAMEGKLYKANVVGSEKEPFSQRYFEKSIEDYLVSIGGVKVFDGQISKEEYERYHKEDPNLGDEGSMGYADQTIKFYVIRTVDKGTIYVQFTADNAAGKLNILQEAALEQTIQMVTSESIVKDLVENGKSILYINFETDKSAVTNEGQTLVDEIGEALQKDKALKVAIEGHTDNTGDAVHNKKLSNDRAMTIMQALLKAGIDKARLSAKGYGAEKPLLANDSETNKAKNRRVELVRIK